MFCFDNLLITGKVQHFLKSRSLDLKSNKPSNILLLSSACWIWNLNINLSRKGLSKICLICAAHPADILHYLTTIVCVCVCVCDVW